MGVDDALRDDVDGGRALSRAERAVRHDDRVHEQSLLGLDARLRQSRVHVRGRVADGRPGRPARHGPARAAAAGRPEVGRRQPPGVRAAVARDSRMPRSRPGGGRAGPHASRTRSVAGKGARLAADRVKAHLLEMAAGQLGEPASALGVQGGWVFVKGAPPRRLQYEAVARAGHFRGGGRVLVAEAFYDPPTTMLDKEFQGNVSAAYTSAFQAALVDVDPDTRRVGG